MHQTKYFQDFSPKKSNLGDPPSTLAQMFWSTFLGCFIFGQNKKGGGYRALPKDLEHFKRFCIVGFPCWIFLFGKNVQWHGRGLRCANNVEALLSCMFDHFSLLKNWKKRKKFRSLICFQRPTI